MFKPNTLPLNLQMFAETADEANTEEVVEVEETTTEEQSESDKIIEKLQKRLDSKTKAEKEKDTQIEELLGRVAELESGSKKSVKEKSEEEKLAEEQKAKDERIANLEEQIKINNITQQADEVFKESGITLGKDMLSIIVNSDEEQTYANVKTLISFIDTQQQQWEIKRNTGKTPDKVTNEQIDAFDAVIKNFK